MRLLITGVTDELLAQRMAGLLARMISWWLENPGRYSAEEMASMMYRLFYRRDPPAIQPLPSV